MAQKTHPQALRRGSLHNYHITWNTHPQNYTTNLQKQLLAKDAVKRFYKRCGYDVSSFNTIFKSQNAITTFSLIREIPLFDKNKLSAFDSNTLRFSTVISNKNEKKPILDNSRLIDLWKRRALAAFYKSDNNFYKWNAEKHVLGRILYRIYQNYPILLKNSISSKFLNDRNVVSSEMLAIHIKNQLEIASARRQKVNVKTYMDRLVKESASIATIRGVKLQVKGRFSSGGSGNKAGRSKKEVSSWGRVPLQTLDTCIDYFYVPAITKLGLCSVRVWIHQK
jgi:hypothetical protein